MSFLFECAIGPVQDFIATARRSRDLRYGSQMLSELSKAAARAIANNGGQLVFPFTADIETDLAAGSKFNAPNKIVAVTTVMPDVTAETASNAIAARLHELRDEAFGDIQTQPLFDRTLANVQVDDLIEFYWASVQFDDNEDYATARRMAESVLSARKATRDFSQFVGPEKPKSSLDGARESVIEENAYLASRDTPAEKQRKAKVLFDRFRARPAERLSGVDLLKRLGDSKSGEQSFPSTSGVAALPFLQYVDNNDKPGDRDRLFVDIKQCLADHDVIVDESDGALVFSSRLAELIPDTGKMRDVVSDVETILTKYAGKVRPRPYYALLIADGDNMGAVIDHQTTFSNAQERHRELSRVLSLFAAQVDGIVKSHQGALVYSGGDDIMAYLPLHTVLDCANALADRFKDALAEYELGNGVSPTLSTGIVVAHHLDPLSDTLDLARSAEKAAKAVTGKHGLAITVSKRSGTDRTITGNRQQLGERLQKMISWRSSGAISAGAAYELQELDRVLGKSDVPEDAMIAEALRIIERKHEAGGGKQIDTQVRDAFEEWIKTDEIELQELTLELIVATVFADAIDMADGKLKE